MKRTTPQHLTISIIIFFAIVTSLVSLRTAPSFTPQCPLRIMPSRATRGTQEAARRRQEDEAMTAAILQKEKDAVKLLLNVRALMPLSVHVLASYQFLCIITCLFTTYSTFRLDKSVPTTTLPSRIPRSTLLLRRNSTTLSKYNLLSSITICHPHRPIGHGNINKTI